MKVPQCNRVKSFIKIFLIIHLSEHGGTKGKGRCFAVESKSFDIYVEEVGGRLRGHITK